MTHFITAHEAAGLSVTAASEKTHEALSKTFAMSAYEDIIKRAALNGLAYVIVRWPEGEFPENEIGDAQYLESAGFKCRRIMDDGKFCFKIVWGKLGVPRDIDESLLFTEEDEKHTYDLVLLT